MDAIKKKMEKLANETNDAENRIAQFEDLKAANEKEAEKYEEQLRIIQKNILKICTKANLPHPCIGPCFSPLPG